MKNLKSNKKTKQILFVSHNLEPEGATWSLFYLVIGFKKLGYGVKVLSPQNGPLLDCYEKEGISVSVEDCFGGKFSRRELDNTDVFFVNTILGYKFIKKLNLKEDKVIWCIRESEKEVYFNKYPDLDKELFKEVSNVVFVAENTMKVYGDVRSDNFVTIHNGLDLEKIRGFVEVNPRRDIRKKHHIADKELVFCIIGAVCLRKGQMEFVQAAIKTLDKTKNRNLKFYIIGGRESLYQKKINELIFESGYGENIKIIKESPGAYEYLLMSDFFVCNSYIESFPRVVLEAMAFELPIIATNVYGISEQIKDGEEGFLIMAGDTGELSRKMQWMIENRVEAQKMAKNARKRVESDFSFPVMLKKYETLIKNICAE